MSLKRDFHFELSTQSPPIHPAVRLCTIAAHRILSPSGMAPSSFARAKLPIADYRKMLTKHTIPRIRQIHKELYARTETYEKTTPTTIRGNRDP